MSYCPNPQCSHQKVTGKPAEYRADIERCVDCGTELQREMPHNAERLRRERIPCPGHLKRRLWLTLAIVGGLLGALGAPTFAGWFGLFNFHGGIASILSGTVLYNGLNQFIFGYLAVEIFALAVPRLRRRRLNDPGLRRNLRIAALITGAVASLINGYHVGGFVEWEVFQESSRFGMVGPLPIGPGIAFHMVVSLIVAGGASLWILAAALVDKYGVGRGFAVMLIVHFVLQALHTHREALTAWRHDAVAGGELALTAATLVAALLAFHYAFRFGDRLAKNLSFKLPTCGTGPLEVGIIPLSVANLIFVFFYYDAIHGALAQFSAGTPLHLATLIVTIVALSFPFSAMFNWRRRRELAEKPGSAAWLKARLMSGAFLIALVVGNHLLVTSFSPTVVRLLPDLLTLLYAYALIADWVTEVLAYWRASDGADLVKLETHQDLGDALEAHRRLEAEGSLSDVTLTGMRFRSLVYFFGPYVPLLVIGRKTPAEDSADCDQPHVVD